MLDLLLGFALALQMHPAAPSTPSPVRQSPAVHVPSGLPKGMTSFRERANDPKVIAAWSANEAQVSTNGGKTFTRVVRSPKDVRDVKFDVYGRMVVLIAKLPDNNTQLLVDSDAGTVVVTTAFDLHDVP